MLTYLGERDTVQSVGTEEQLHQQVQNTVFGARNMAWWGEWGPAHPCSVLFPTTLSTFPLSPNSCAGVTRLIAWSYLRESGSSSTDTHDLWFCLLAWFLLPLAQILQDPWQFSLHSLKRKTAQRWTSAGKVGQYYFLFSLIPFCSSPQMYDSAQESSLHELHKYTKVRYPWHYKHIFLPSHSVLSRPGEALSTSVHQGWAVGSLLRLHGDASQNSIHHSTQSSWWKAPRDDGLLEQEWQSLGPKMRALLNMATRDGQVSLWTLPPGPAKFGGGVYPGAGVPRAKAA